MDHSYSVFQLSVLVQCTIWATVYEAHSANSKDFSEKKKKKSPNLSNNETIFLCLVERDDNEKWHSHFSIRDLIVKILLALQAIWSL